LENQLFRLFHGGDMHDAGGENPPSHDDGGVPSIGMVAKFYKGQDMFAAASRLEEWTLSDAQHFIGMGVADSSGTPNNGSNRMHRHLLPALV
jgi:hypothetical protein